MAEPAEPKERAQLYRRLRVARERQADLRELRAWIEGRVAEREEHGSPGWPHDLVFLQTTKPILDWLEAEIAACASALGEEEGHDDDFEPRSEFADLVVEEGDDGITRLVDR